MAQLDEFKVNTTIGGVARTEQPIDYDDAQYIPLFNEFTGFELAADHTGVVVGSDSNFIEAGSDIKNRLIPVAQINSEWAIQNGLAKEVTVTGAPGKNWIRNSQLSPSETERVPYLVNGTYIRNVYQPRGYCPGKSRAIAYSSGSGSFDTALFGVGERANFLVTSGSSAFGGGTRTIRVTLNGVNNDIEVAQSQSTTQVATTIRNSFNGSTTWYAGGTGAIVIFIALSYGGKTDASFTDLDTSGVAITVTTVRQGDQSAGTWKGSALGHRIYSFNAIVLGGGGAGAVTPGGGVGGGGGGGGGAVIGGFTFPKLGTSFLDVAYSVGGTGEDSTLTDATGGGVITGVKGSAASGATKGDGGAATNAWDKYYEVLSGQVTWSSDGLNRSCTFRMYHLDGTYTDTVVTLNKGSSMLATEVATAITTAFSGNSYWTVANGGTETITFTAKHPGRRERSTWNFTNSGGSSFANVTTTGTWGGNTNLDALPIRTPGTPSGYEVIQAKVRTGSSGGVTFSPFTLYTVGEVGVTTSVTLTAGAKTATDVAIAIESAYASDPYWTVTRSTATLTFTSKVYGWHIPSTFNMTGSGGADLGSQATGTGTVGGSNSNGGLISTAGRYNTITLWSTTQAGSDGGNGGSLNNDGVAGTTSPITGTIKANMVGTESFTVSNSQWEIQAGAGGAKGTTTYSTNGGGGGGGGCAIVNTAASATLSGGAGTNGSGSTGGNGGTGLGSLIVVYY